MPLIGGALAVVVVTSVLYLRSATPSLNTAAVTPPPATIQHLHGTYTTAFDFVDASHGWALVLDYTEPGSRFWIFATSDGASRWRLQFGATAPSDGPFGPATSIYVQFFDLQHGFAFAGDLYRTVDGGAHWQLVNAPMGGPLFTFATARHGWMLPVDWSVPPQLYTTEDGGLTWSAISTPLPQGLNAQPFAGFGFRDDGEGWAGTALNAPIVYRTLDGGESWVAVKVPTDEPADLYYTSVRLLPGAAVLAIVSTPNGFIGGYYSDDRGDTWRALHPLPEPEWLYNATFLDATHWWVARYGFLYKTSTAGQDWSRVLVRPLPGGWNIGPAHAIDVDHGWWSMTSTTDSLDSALMMTSDGGADWRTVSMPQPA